jgi:ribosomal protein S18 acetylase RimI-like enzyme
VSSPEAIRLGPEYFRLATEVLTRAFLDYPLMQYAVPDEIKRQRATFALYASVLRYSMRFGESFTTPGVEGAAGWLPPENPFPTFFRMVRAGMLSVPFRFGWTGFQRLQAVDHVAVDRHLAHAPARHWYLWAIGVDPQHQHKGVAGRLMRPILNRADREDLPCYLETHKESNVQIYERYGFQIASKNEVPGHPLTLWAMLRPPGAATPA